MTRRTKRLPAPERPPLPDFAPVPRRYRHDGWTPERQKAFIAALAETGCVERAARMVNMAQANCYTLRRAPGAEAFRRAWDAALDFGLKRLKDIAFERAIEGYLVPVFVGGRLMGFRRKHNDALLMFCPRHYGQDGEGRRTTVNYFSTRATLTSSGQASAGAVAGSVGGPAGRPSTSLGTNESGAGEGPPPPLACGERSPSPSRGGAAQAEASATTVRTVVSGRLGANDNEAARLDAAAAVLNGFAGVRLDAEAEAAIAAALEACAARARAVDAAFDEGGEAAADAGEAAGEPFVRVGPGADPYRGELEPSVQVEEFVPFVPGEAHWTLAGLVMPPEQARIEAMLEAREAAKRPPRRRAGKRAGGSGG